MIYLLFLRTNRCQLAPGSELDLVPTNRQPRPTVLIFRNSVLSSAIVIGILFSRCKDEQKLCSHVLFNSGGRMACDCFGCPERTETRLINAGGRAAPRLQRVLQFISQPQNQVIFSSDFPLCLYLKNRALSFPRAPTSPVPLDYVLLHHQHQHSLKCHPVSQAQPYSAST